MSNGFLGSPNLLVSTSRLDVIPKAPNEWTDENYSLYKFSFINKQACSVIINGGEQIFLESEQGFETDRFDAKINSFIIVEPNVTFNWIGAF